MGLFGLFGKANEVQRFTSQYRSPFKKEFAKYARKHTTLGSLWGQCKRADWMLWMISSIGFVPACSLRQFACYCARQFDSLMTDPRSQSAINAAEKFARAEIDWDELEKARAAAYEVLAEAKRRNDVLAEAVAWTAAATAKEDGFTAANDAAIYTIQVAELRGKDIAYLREMQANKLRELLGNPFMEQE